MTALKTPEQITQAKSPIWPADPATFDYQGSNYDVYRVPVEGHSGACPGGERADESQFVDPANPEAGLITWQGSWRTLDPVWRFAPQWTNFARSGPSSTTRAAVQHLAIAVIGTIGTVVSCTLVACGFALPLPWSHGALLLIDRHHLPTAAVTLIPTYTIFVRLGWVGSWLPLLVPAFFANAFDVFLLRQYLLTISRSRWAAAIDGAGPLRTLVSVVLPQAWPGVVAVSIFHLVYSWNDFFGPLIYLASTPDLQPLSVGLSQFNGIYYQNPHSSRPGP